MNGPDAALNKELKSLSKLERKGAYPYTMEITIRLARLVQCGQTIVEMAATTLKGSSVFRHPYLSEHRPPATRPNIEAALAMETA